MNEILEEIRMNAKTAGYGSYPHLELKRLEKDVLNLIEAFELAIKQRDQGYESAGIDAEFWQQDRDAIVTILRKGVT